MLTIITVVRNNLVGIKRTVRSLIAQIDQGFEYVVIDGGSSDGTLEFLQTVQRVNKLVSEPDDGLYYAMNKALSISSGCYVYFLNAGDELLTADITQKVCRLLKSAHGAVVCCSIELYLNDIHWVVGGNSKSKNLPHHQSVFYPEKHYKVCRYNTNLIVSADAEFTVHALSTCGRQNHAIVVARSELGGFTFRRLASFQGAFQLAMERIHIDEMVLKKRSLKLRLFHLTAVIWKSILLQLLGLKGVVRAMRIKRLAADYFCLKAR